jgi:pyruvate,water dikinase
VALKEEVLAQFLGDETFPVEWSSETERELFWVYDDLHCPQPVSPMYFEIGGWWLTCHHMFRRFGTPFACDWVAKKVNGYVYTAAVPAEAGLTVDEMEYGAKYTAQVPLDPDYASTIGTYLDAVLPTYGQEFVTWWRERLVPEMERNFAYLEERLDRQDEMTLMSLACLFEDAIDIHDRHWKIHWILNFAQLALGLNLQSVMQRTHGRIDERLLGRLQNSARDRNWDSIEALWKMKEEVKRDGLLSEALAAGKPTDITAALGASQRGRRFIVERVTPYQREYGWHAVWSHEFVFPTVREQAEPVIELIRDYLRTDYDFPSTIAALEVDIASATRELLGPLQGEAREEMQAAIETSVKMAPLTPDHHFYIDQGANAHLRLVLIAIGRKLVAQGVLDAPDDVVFFKYNELRVFLANPAAMDGRALVAQRKAERAKAYTLRPREWIGTATKTQLAFPYLDMWGFPQKFYRQALPAEDAFMGIGCSPGTVEGIARVVLREEQFDDVRAGDILVCQMTNPAWITVFTKIAGLVTDAGGMLAHPAVLAREFGIPAVVGSSVATQRIRDGDSIRIDGTTGVVEILPARARKPAGVGFTA